MARLNQELLCEDAAVFSALESQHQESSLYGVTDGKAIGTYLEQKFKLYLKEKYNFLDGNSAIGIDFPDLLVDIKVTSMKQPQSSCPFKSARSLRIIRTIFVSAERTADFQMTRGIRNILNNQGNKDDLIAFILDKNLPVDEMEAANIADEILVHPPGQGFLTISNALQWRLQYTRVIDLAGQEEGLIAIYREN